MSVIERDSLLLGALLFGQLEGISQRLLPLGFLCRSHRLVCTSVGPAKTAILLVSTCMVQRPEGDSLLEIRALITLSGMMPAAPR